MILGKTKFTIRNVKGITQSDVIRIKCFLQGAVYCWIKNRKDEVFAARDLVGGENFDWNGTPCYCLYRKHADLGKTNEHAIDGAGKDLGWLLKSAISEDKRTFEITTKGRTNGYRWIGNEP